ncbi:MAG TPA: HD domain-containing phosphohydrolase [Methylomirabilota bacterium]|nr:HD domain-containing phosphohydrolase [Methylomirabilota bacterium]
MTSSPALRVLAVDDNASLLRFLVSAFSANACAVTPAPTAEQALELIAANDFDLVVSDIKMPGLSGLDLLRAVKSRQPATPVVLITGAPSVNSAVFGLRHGAYDYLPKPFSIKEVQQLVARVRADREKWNGQTPLPAGLADELARRQVSVDMLFRIGDLALQTQEPRVFVEKVLQLTGESLRNDGALILVRDEHGVFTTTQHGDPSVVDELRTLLQANFDALMTHGGREALSLRRSGGRVEAVAALIPGVGQSLGVLAVGRLAASLAFLPDERDMVVGFAQATAVALQKLVLREDHERNLVDTITAFVNAIESKDPYLKGHSARVALYATEIARAMRLDDDTVEMVNRAAMLHDLGKLSIMDTILRKPERLTAEEFTLIKAHPVVGERILKPLRFLAREACAVRHHHERFDGSGYPDGLSGASIPQAARIITVADVFDAVTSNRPYRTALGVEAARAEIVRGRGTHFDPDAADAFLSIGVERLVEITRHYDSLTSAPLPADLAVRAFAHAQ